ncbi:MAG: hypothetical protein Fur007_03850 [Rhodoferax sp.]
MPLMGVSRSLVAGGLVFGCCPALWAHAVRHGAIEIDHPYALPSAAGSTQGRAYLRAIINHGPQTERLLGATTPRALNVVLRRQLTDAPQGGPDLASIDIAPGQRLPLGHTGPYQLSLMGLREPLRTGERFALTLLFEHAGPVTVQVWVQAPRPASRDVGRDRN